MRPYRLTLAACLAITALARPLAGQQPPTNPPPDERFKVDILVIAPHPDDETTIAGYLAKAVLDEHRRVAVVVTTRGDAGSNLVGYESARALGEIREIETREALASIGITHVFFLRMPDTPGLDLADVLRSLETANHGAALADAVRFIRLTRPEVVITMLPATVAGENHEDHQASGVIATEAFDLAGRDHTAQLLPQLTLLLRHIGRASAAISAVAIALGPGSWSGLRVGMSTAKGLTLARGLPIIGIGTLDALAYQHHRHGATVVPLIRLGRERFATTGLSTREPRNVTLAELCAEINGRALFCGDIDPEVRETLQLKLGQRAQFPTPAANLRRPGFLAELAWQRFQAGETDDAATLEPIYLGQPVKVKA